jgi:hypothetical protein
VFPCVWRVGSHHEWVEEVVAHDAMHVCVQRAGAKEEGRKESEVTLPEGTVVLRLECRRLSPGVEGAGAV